MMQSSNSKFDLDVFISSLIGVLFRSREGHVKFHHCRSIGYIVIRRKPFFHRQTDRYMYDETIHQTLLVGA